jgi:hypothetical protein
MLSPTHQRIVRALGDTLLPSTGEGDPGGGEVLPEALHELAAALPPADRNRIRMLLMAFDLAAIPRFGRPFSMLPEAKRERYVEGWMRSRIGARRIVYRALRTLCMTAYYQDARVWPALGYDGPARGRRARAEAGELREGLA